MKKPKSVSLFVFTSKCNMVEDHVSWQGLVTVKSVEVMWALSFDVGRNGEVQSG